MLTTQARTGLLAAGIVGSLFLAAGGVIGVAALARQHKPLATSPTSAASTTPARPSDPPTDSPEDARAIHARELARLRDKLLADIDAVIRAERARGAGIDYLLKERKAFAENGVTPILPKLLPASRAYLDGRRAADDAAYILGHRWWKKAPTWGRLEEIVRTIIERNAGGAVLIDGVGRLGTAKVIDRGLYAIEPKDFDKRHISVECDWATRPDRAKVLLSIRAALDVAEYAAGPGR